MNEYLQVFQADGKILTRQVEGFQNVFAAGDITNRDSRKLAYIADLQSEQAAKNIALHAAGKKMSTKDGAPPKENPMAFVVLSPDKGVGQLPMFGKAVLGKRVVRMLKGADLFASQNFKLVGLKAPPITSTPPRA